MKTAEACWAVRPDVPQTHWACQLQLGDEQRLSAFAGDKIDVFRQGLEMMRLRWRRWP
jgi:hypothetical protein